jgi:hypothetical protein
MAKQPLSTIKTVAEESAPVTVEPPAPAYNPENLDDVLKRLRGMIDDLKNLSADIAAQHKKHSRAHYMHGAPAGLPIDAPVAHDPATAARLHTLQAAIGEFVHAAGAVA